MPFKTAWWLQNPHFQTIWPAIFRFPAKPYYKRERLELHDGDFIDIDWCGDNTPDTQIVLLFHGLEGSSDSPYIRGMVSTLVDQGYQCAAVNFRGCSGELNRLPRSYHSGATDDLNEIIGLISKHHPSSALHAIGYSLGGNVLLKWCAESGDKNSLSSVVAVSVPYKLAVAAITLDSNQFFSRLYRWRLLRSLKSKALEKIRQGILKMNASQVESMTSFYEFDDQLTAPLHGYNSADDYYSRASSYPHLDKIHIPALLLHAADDPFMNTSVIPDHTDESDYINLEVSPNGGHVGFFQPGINGNNYWLETRIADFIGSINKDR